MVDCAEEEDLGFGSHWLGGVERSRSRNQGVKRKGIATKEMWTVRSDEAELKNGMSKLWEIYQLLAAGELLS